MTDRELGHGQLRALALALALGAGHCIMRAGNRIVGIIPCSQTVPWSDGDRSAIQLTDAAHCVEVTRGREEAARVFAVR